jgi:hypothetical protein
MTQPTTPPPESAALDLSPCEDRPLHVRITPHGVKLQFFHSSRALPPFRINLPFEEFAQLITVVSDVRHHRLPGQEAYLGFSEQLLALHQIDAVEVPVHESHPSS